MPRFLPFSLSLSKRAGFTSFLDKTITNVDRVREDKTFFFLFQTNISSPGFESVEKIPPAAFAVSPTDHSHSPFFSLSLSPSGVPIARGCLSTVVLEEVEEEEGVGHSGMSPGGQPTTSCSRHRFTEGRRGLIGGWRVF